MSGAAKKGAAVCPLGIPLTDYKLREDPQPFAPMFARSSTFGNTASSGHSPIGGGNSAAGGAKRSTTPGGGLPSAAKPVTPIHSLPYGAFAVEDGRRVMTPSGHAYRSRHQFNYIKGENTFRQPGSPNKKGLPAVPSGSAVLAGGASPPIPRSPSPAMRGGSIVGDDSFAAPSPGRRHTQQSTTGATDLHQYLPRRAHTPSLVLSPGVTISRSRPGTSGFAPSAAGGLDMSSLCGTRPGTAMTHEFAGGRPQQARRDIAFLPDCVSPPHSINRAMNSMSPITMQPDTQQQPPLVPLESSARPVSRSQPNVRPTSPLADFAPLATQVESGVRPPSSSHSVRVRGLSLGAAEHSPAKAGPNSVRRSPYLCTVAVPGVASGNSKVLEPSLLSPSDVRHVVAKSQKHLLQCENIRDAASWLESISTWYPTAHLPELEHQIKTLRGLLSGEDVPATDSASEHHRNPCKGNMSILNGVAMRAFPTVSCGFASMNRWSDPDACQRGGRDAEALVNLATRIHAILLLKEAVEDDEGPFSSPNASIHNGSGSGQGSIGSDEAWQSLQSAAVDNQDHLRRLFGHHFVPAHDGPRDVLVDTAHIPPPAAGSDDYKLRVSVDASHWMLHIRIGTRDHLFAVPLSAQTATSGAPLSVGDLVHTLRESIAHAVAEDATFLQSQQQRRRDQRGPDHEEDAEEDAVFSQGPETAEDDDVRDIRNSDRNAMALSILTLMEPPVEHHADKIHAPMRRASGSRTRPWGDLWQGGVLDANLNNRHVLNQITSAAFCVQLDICGSDLHEMRPGDGDVVPAGRFEDKSIASVGGPLEGSLLTSAGILLHAQLSLPSVSRQQLLADAAEVTDELLVERMAVRANALLCPPRGLICARDLIEYFAGDAASDLLSGGFGFFNGTEDASSGACDTVDCVLRTPLQREGFRATIVAAAAATAPPPDPAAAPPVEDATPPKKGKAAPPNPRKAAPLSPALVEAKPATPPPPPNPLLLLALGGGVQASHADLSAIATMLDAAQPAVSPGSKKRKSSAGPVKGQAAAPAVALTSPAPSAGAAYALQQLTTTDDGRVLLAEMPLPVGGGGGAEDDFYREMTSPSSLNATVSTGVRLNSAVSGPDGAHRPTTSGTQSGRDIRRQSTATSRGPAHPLPGSTTPAPEHDMEGLPALAAGTLCSTLGGGDASDQGLGTLGGLHAPPPPRRFGVAQPISFFLPRGFVLENETTVAKALQQTIVQRSEQFKSMCIPIKDPRLLYVAAAVVLYRLSQSSTCGRNTSSSMTSRSLGGGPSHRPFVPILHHLATPLYAGAAEVSSCSSNPGDGLSRAATTGALSFPDLSLVYPLNSGELDAFLHAPVASDAPTSRTMRSSSLHFAATATAAAAIPVIAAMDVPPCFRRYLSAGHAMPQPLRVGASPGCVSGLRPPAGGMTARPPMAPVVSIVRAVVGNDGHSNPNTNLHVVTKGLRESSGRGDSSSNGGFPLRGNPCGVADVLFSFCGTHDVRMSGSASTASSITATQRLSAHYHTHACASTVPLATDPSRHALHIAYAFGTCGASADDTFVCMTISKTPPANNAHLSGEGVSVAAFSTMLRQVIKELHRV